MSDHVLRIGVVNEETIDFPLDSTPPPHHEIGRTLVDGLEDEEIDVQERAKLAAKPWWKRPSPWW
jgi:hypothetical protein